MEEKPIYYVRNHPMYPERLKVLADSPERLYVLGNLPEPRKKSVAIVGARACSAYGRKQARYFAGSLAARGIQVISGLAAGIDAGMIRLSVGLENINDILADLKKGFASIERL